jgi:hypothetical protein
MASSLTSGSEASNVQRDALNEHLKRAGFEGDQDEQKPIFWCRERTVFVDGKPASSPWLPIHPPRRHLRLERCLEGRDELLKLVRA